MYFKTRETFAEKQMNERLKISNMFYEVKFGNAAKGGEMKRESKRELLRMTYSKEFNI